MSEGVEKWRRSADPRRDLPRFYGPPLYRVELRPRPTTNQSRGVVGIITLTSEDFKPSRLSDTLDWLRDLERRFPRVSFVASLPTDAHHELGVVHQALLSTYILLAPPPVSLDVLRRVLTTTVGLPQNVARWFRVHADLNVGEAEVIEHLVRAGLDSPAVHRLPALLDPVTRKGLSFVSAAALFTLGRGLESGNTSNASSIIAGVVALVRSRYPSLTNEFVRMHLQKYVTDLGPPRRDDKFGYGVPRADLAVNPPSLSAYVSGPSQARTEYICTWSARGFGGVAAYTFRWYVNGAYVGSGKFLETGLTQSPTELLVIATDAVGNQKAGYKYVDVSPSNPVGDCEEPWA